MSALLRKMLVAYSDRPSRCFPIDRTASPLGDSTLITSAPKSASRRPQNGPATVDPSSRIR